LAAKTGKARLPTVVRL